MTEIEIAWLAGLLEGEGSFGLTGYAAKKSKVFPTISLAMTDLDIIERAGALIGGQGQARIMARVGQRMGTGTVRKTTYRWRVSGNRAIEVMRLILPYMGERRTARIREILGIWEARNAVQDAKNAKYEALSAMYRLPAT
jgi:hypothetical protein